MASGPCRVLLLTASSSIGGTERMVLELARGLDRERFEVSVGSLDGEGLLTDACLEAGIRAWNWRVGRPVWRFVRVLGWASRMRRYSFDIVQTFGLQADLIGRLLKKRLGGGRLVCSIRSAEERRGPFAKRLDRATASAADLFLANSEAGKRTRVEREDYDPARIRVIHNGIELDPPGLADRDAARRALGLGSDDAPAIAHVANLRSMKAHGEALEAAAQVLQSDPRAVFLFAGRDDSEGRIPAKARSMGLGDRVRFLGFHPRPREVMRAADVVILPSHYEGCPVSILEAMAERRPVVASEVGGIPELVRHEREALLVPSGSPKRLAEALLRLAGDAGLRSRLADAGRSRVESEFSLPRMIERYASLFEEMRR